MADERAIEELARTIHEIEIEAHEWAGATMEYRISGRFVVNPPFDMLEEIDKKVRLEMARRLYERICR